MPSKTEVIVAVIGVAIIGFIIYYFFLSKKPQVQSTTSTTSPLTTISSDVGSFVSGVQNAFSKVLSGGGTIMSDLRKDIGWGEKQLGNTIGIISSGASRFGRTVVSDVEHFVHGVEHVFGNVGSTLSTGVSDLEKAFGYGIHGVEADVRSAVPSVMRSFERGVENALKTFENLPKNLPASTFHVRGFESGVSKAPKEIMKDAKSISTGVEHGVDSFINGVKGLFSRF